MFREVARADTVLLALEAASAGSATRRSAAASAAESRARHDKYTAATKAPHPAPAKNR